MLRHHFYHFYMRIVTFVISFHPIPILLCSISIKCLFIDVFFFHPKVCVCCSLISDSIQSEQIGWEMRFHTVDMCDWKWLRR